jgi:hypothetical protein
MSTVCSISVYANEVPLKVGTQHWIDQMGNGLYTVRVTSLADKLLITDIKVDRGNCVRSIGYWPKRSDEILFGQSRDYSFVNDARGQCNGVEIEITTVKPKEHVYTFSG